MLENVKKAYLAAPKGKASGSNPEGGASMFNGRKKKSETLGISIFTPAVITQLLTTLSYSAPCHCHRTGG